MGTKVLYDSNSGANKRECLCVCFHEAVKGSAETRMFYLEIPEYSPGNLASWNKGALDEKSSWATHTRDKGERIPAAFSWGIARTLKGWWVNKENMVKAIGGSFALVFDLTEREEKALTQEDL